MWLDVTSHFEKLPLLTSQVGVPTPTCDVRRGRATLHLLCLSFQTQFWWGNRTMSRLSITTIGGGFWAKWKSRLHAYQCHSSPCVSLSRLSRIIHYDTHNQRKRRYQWIRIWLFKIFYNQNVINFWWLWLGLFEWDYFILYFILLEHFVGSPKALCQQVYKNSWVNNLYIHMPLAALPLGQRRGYPLLTPLWMNALALAHTNIPVCLLPCCLCVLWGGHSP